jgi:Raf kinase inhibitor-like YbhB/YbcL family protein
MELTSKAFKDRSTIPARYTGEGQDVSPPLEWSGVPRGCKSFVLICEDPDAPKREGQDHPFTHWLIYNISGSVSALPEGLDKRAELRAPVLADQGRNSFGKIGYGGPMPPPGHGTHRYAFTLYALDAAPMLRPGDDKASILKAIAPHVLASARLTGKYERALTKAS